MHTVETVFPMAHSVAWMAKFFGAYYNASVPGANPSPARMLYFIALMMHCVF